MCLDPFHVAAFLFRRVVFHFMATSQFVAYLLTCRWTFELSLVWATRNKAFMIIHAQEKQTYIFISLGQTPRGGILEWCGLLCEIPDCFPKRAYHPMLQPTT